MKKKISIVMPVHNTGMYLEEALKTIFSQTFQEFELICVDDASKDELTALILEKYEREHENIQIIRLNKSVGAGEARNIGFSKVRGEYTIFLDADDVFADNLLEKMYQSIVLHQADVCVCGYQSFYTQDKEKYFGSKHLPDENTVNFINREDWLLDIPTSAWNKLCRTQFLKESGAYFQSLRSCNDLYFSCFVMIDAGKRCYVPQIPLVFYRINTESQISSNRNPLDLYKAVMLLKEELEKNNQNMNYLQWIGALLLRNGVWEMEHCSEEAYNQNFYHLLGEFFTAYAIEFRNEMLNICASKVKELPYESKWFFDCMDFQYQLRLTVKKLKESIKGEERLFLWGLGYRGRIFEQFCMEQGIYLQGVADIKNENVGTDTDYGNRIFSTEYVLKSGGLIIASNKKIYEYLLKKNLRLLNLEDFYLF